MFMSYVDANGQTQWGWNPYYYNYFVGMLQMIS